jgi:PTS system nitrogen regulatory IIA component
VVERLPIPADVDRASVLAMLLAREGAGSTAVGNGVALPHVRSPLVLAQDAPAVAACYLANPVEFGAPDGKPVSVLFLLVTPTVRVHLQLLARLAFALRTPDFQAAVAVRADLADLMRAARKAELAATSGG